MPLVPARGPEPVKTLTMMATGVHRDIVPVPLQKIASTIPCNPCLSKPQIIATPNIPVNKLHQI